MHLERRPPIRSRVSAEVGCRDEHRLSEEVDRCYTRTHELFSFQWWGGVLSLAPVGFLLTVLRSSDAFQHGPAPGALDQSLHLGAGQRRLHQHPLLADVDADGRHACKTDSCCHVMDKHTNTHTQEKTSRITTEKGLCHF